MKGYLRGTSIYFIPELLNSELLLLGVKKKYSGISLEKLTTCCLINITLTCLRDPVQQIDYVYVSASVLMMIRW